MSTLVSKEKVKESLASHGTTVLLVDDQPIIGEAVRRMLEAEDDIQFHFCSDPTIALQKAIEINPTVILQDLVMPDIDGLQLVKFFRATPQTKDVPLIVLSVKEEPKVKAEAFALGANDYLVKLPDKVELVARIRHHSNGYINLLERNDAYEKLYESQEHLNAELAEAADYVKSLLPKPIDDDIKSDWKFITSTKLGGDSFGYHWLGKDHFAIYLLDVCGHGVGAALLSISVMNVLRSGSLSDTNFHDPSEVLKSLNETFPMEKQNNMFFTIWYGIYNRSTRQIIYSNGGHPPALLFTGKDLKSAKLEQLTTPGFVIGGVQNVEFENKTSQLDEFATLYVLSDGVYEIVRKDGTMWTFDAFVEMLKEKNSKQKTPFSVDQVLKEISKMKVSEEFDDDFSIINFIL